MVPTLKPESTDEDLVQRTSSPDAKLDAALFRRKLMGWYKSHARELPWRGVNDPYRTWLSEVMLQQTRVGAVVEHYETSCGSFPPSSPWRSRPSRRYSRDLVRPGYYRAGAHDAQDGAVPYP